MKIRVIFHLFIMSLVPVAISAQCDVTDGMLIELQGTTTIDGLLRGSSGCIVGTTVSAPLTFSGGVLTLGQNGATTGQVLQWNGSAWVPATIGGSSADSTFIKLSGSYANKRITDNVYRYGTTGLRTDDTTGVLNLTSATAAKPAISAIDNQLLLQYQRGTMPPWRINQTNASNGDGTTNNVLQILYNGLNGFTKDESADAIFGMGMEPHWVDAEGDTVSEWHVYFNDMKGNVHRPITGFFDYHNPLESSWGFGTEFIHIDGTLLNQHAKVTINRTNSSSAYYPLEVYKHKKTITPTSTSYTKAEMDSVTAVVVGNYSTSGESPATGLATMLRFDNTQERGAAFYMGLVDQSGAGFDSGSDFVMYNNNSGSWKESIRIKDANGNVGIKQIAPTQALDVGGSQLLRGHLRANTVGDSAGVTIKLPNAAGATPSLEWEFSTGTQGAYAHLYPYNSTSSTANASIAFGKIGSMHTLSYKNTVVGITGATFATGTGNTSLFGWGAGNALNGGYENTMIGSQSGYNTTTGFQNAFFGIYAGYTNTTGYQNMFLGRRAGYTNLTGIRNAAVGTDALRLNSTGNDNVAIGGQAGDAITGSNNTVIGASAGRLVTGSGNILIGRQAAETQTSISNLLYIDNSNTSTPLIGGDLSSNEVGVNIDPSSIGAALHVHGNGTTSSTYSGIFEKSDGTDVLTVRDDGKVAIANDGFNEALNINGQARADAYDIRPWETTDNTNDGELHYEDGDGNTAYLTIGAGERRFPVLPHMVQLQAVDYNVDWTTGRTKAFWTVPARFNGWKVSKVYVSVSSIGSVTGNVVEVEKGGAGLSSQTISSATHTITLDTAIATDDIFTFDITGVGATASKGLFIEIELRHN